MYYVEKQMIIQVHERQTEPENRSIYKENA